MCRTQLLTSTAITTGSGSRNSRNSVGEVNISFFDSGSRTPVSRRVDPVLTVADTKGTARERWGGGRTEVYRDLVHETVEGTKRRHGRLGLLSTRTKLNFVKLSSR